jgi:hypothetical protein
VSGLYDKENEISVSIKSRKCPEKLRNYQLLKKDSAPCSDNSSITEDSKVNFRTYSYVLPILQLFSFHKFLNQVHCKLYFTFLTSTLLAASFFKT